MVRHTGDMTSRGRPSYIVVPAVPNMANRLATDVATVQLTVSVFLLALARRQGLSAAPLPAIATGFCSGMSQTAGPCGALTGAVMALGLVFGRHSGTDPAAPTYQAVKTLVQRFSEEFGATGCADLLGCHLGTPEGQKTFTEQKLHRRCLDYTGRAAELAAAIIDQAGAPHPLA